MTIICLLLFFFFIFSLFFPFPTYHPLPPTHLNLGAKGHRGKQYWIFVICTFGNRELAIGLRYHAIRRWSYNITQTVHNMPILNEFLMEKIQNIKSYFRWHVLWQKNVLSGKFFIFYCQYLYFYCFYEYYVICDKKGFFVWNVLNNMKSFRVWPKLMLTHILSPWLSARDSF